MNQKAVKFHPGPEAAAKEAKSPLVVSVAPDEPLEMVLTGTVNIRNKGRNRKKKEK